MTDQIGTTAGKIWQHLHQNGPATINKLTSEVGESDRLILMGIGWLARENQVIFAQEGRFKYIALKEPGAKSK